jgi:hypothetical protein
MYRDETTAVIAKAAENLGILALKAGLLRYWKAFILVL